MPKTRVVGWGLQLAVACLPSFGCGGVEDVYLGGGAPAEPDEQRSTPSEESHDAAVTREASAGPLPEAGDGAPGAGWRDASADGGSDATDSAAPAMPRDGGEWPFADAGDRRRADGGVPWPCDTRGPYCTPDGEVYENECAADRAGARDEYYCPWETL